MRGAEFVALRSMTHNALNARLSSQSVERRLNATNRPSGETCGSETRSSVARSFAVKGRAYASPDVMNTSAMQAAINLNIPAPYVSAARKPKPPGVAVTSRGTDSIGMTRAGLADSQRSGLATTRGRYGASRYALTLMREPLVLTGALFALAPPLRAADSLVNNF